MHKGKSLVEQLFDGEIYAAEQFNPYESKDYKNDLISRFFYDILQKKN